MYRPGLTKRELEELAAAGLTPEDVDTGPVEIWPDVLPVYQLFCSMSTQWRVGMSGAIGLDYSVLYQKMSRMHLDPESYDLLELDIQIMESAALNAMRSKSDS